MSSAVRTDAAIILPISDVSLGRDVNLKLRLAGVVTAVSPCTPWLVLLSDPHPVPDSSRSKSSGGCRSVLVDLSLCVDQSHDANGASWGRTSRQVVPPELKSCVMVIGHLTQRGTPVDTRFLHDSKQNDDEKWTSEVHLHHAAPQLQHPAWGRVNRWFVVEALLVKQLDASFDLALWNRTARTRSEHEWSMYMQQQRQQQQQQQQVASATESRVADRKGKRKASVD